VTGQQKPQDAPWIKPVAYVLTAGLFALIWVFVSRGCDSLLPDSPEIQPQRQRADRYGDAMGAWVAAEGHVEGRLVSPGSADFGGQKPDVCTKETSPGHWAVVGWVDSQNRFGAKIRSNFVCHLKYEKGGWSLISLDMAER